MWKLVYLGCLENLAWLYHIKNDPKFPIVYRWLTDLSSDQCLFITGHIMKRSGVQRNNSIPFKSQELKNEKDYTHENMIT